MNVIQINQDFFKHDAQAGGFFPNTHTNLILDIEKFISTTGQNYLVEGIRGTGKTHILKMISNKCLAEYNSNKILPVYISLASVSQWMEKDMVSFRLHLYSTIVKSTIEIIEFKREIIELSGNSEALKAIKKLAQMFGFNKEENFNNLIKEIKKFTQELLNQLTYNVNEQLIKEIKEEMSGVSGEVGYNSVKAGAKYDEKNLFSKELKFVGKNLSHEDAASFIIQFFKELKQIFNLDYTYILIDECSEVSKEAQIEVFRLLKLIRGAFNNDIHVNPIYFCATVYPAPITYYPSKLKGDSFNFEMGHDAVVEYLDLDELDEEYLDFFREITNKRLKEFIHNDEINNYLDIFENEKVFILAAYLSNGNIRRYIEILKHAYDNLKQKVNLMTNGKFANKKGISTKDIEEAVYSIVNDQILSFNRLSQDDLQLLHEIIFKISKRNKKIETENISKGKKIPANVYFTISRLHAMKYGNLIMQGALHDKGRTRRRKYHIKDGVRGLLYMLDLSVAFNESAINRMRANEIFTKDLKVNAKSGYLYCQDIEI
ncbi:MAG: hypothetical protein ACREVX_01170 [Clostridium sp.]|uniref:ORC-CDC6 family AAA ATPase n=1 Tax=Clostridium sp. TaxID=1506 RepID=UPI003D6D0B92